MIDTDGANEKLQGLPAYNDAQANALLDSNHAILVVAGAGTGKTRVLTGRIAYLLIKNNVEPESILAVTFSNKAAREMSERIANLLPFGMQPSSIGTFHSMSVRFLREFGDEIGVSRNFVIYDSDDQKKAMKRVLKSLDIDDKRFPPSGFLYSQEHFKNATQDPVENADDELDEKVFRAYREFLEDNNALDFSDLLYRTWQLLKTNQGVREALQDRYSHILVDEYQDTNDVQREMIHLLKGESNNLFVVGDEDQSIYGWRGAVVENILNFDRDFPGASIHKLEQNYRSTSAILDVANAVISNNAGRRGKQLWTEKEGGTLVKYTAFNSEKEEAGFVVGKARALSTTQGTPLSDTAIFYRTNAQSRVIEEAALRLGIPYQVVGGLRFYERKEIKDSLAILRLMLNPSDSISFHRITGALPVGIGKKTLEKLEGVQKDFGGDIIQALLETQVVKGATLKKIRKFGQTLQAVRLAINSSAPLAARVEAAIVDSGYLPHLRAQGTEEAQNRIDNIYELLTSLEDFEKRHQDASLETFLQHVSLLSDVDSMEDGDAGLTLMTVHASKGLEFTTVFVTGLEETLFPHSRSMESPDELEEERRLCYVAMTRAKANLFLSSCVTRRMYNNIQYNAPSRFLEEIPEELLEVRSNGFSNLSEVRAGYRRDW